MAYHTKVHVVLDIDGTLICSRVDQFDPFKPSPNMCIQYTDDGDDELGYHRPGLIEFLNMCFNDFASVSLWTAGNSTWLDLFIQSLPDEMHDKFLLTWHREHCDLRKPVYVKPLVKMWDTETAKKVKMHSGTTIIIDDVTEGCVDNPSNHVKIPRFDYYCRRDNVLKKAMQCMKSVTPVYG
jgi:hypothetical protein